MWYEWRQCSRHHVDSSAQHLPLLITNHYKLIILTPRLVIIKTLATDKILRQTEGQTE